MSTTIIQATDRGTHIEIEADFSQASSPIDDPRAMLHPTAADRAAVQAEAARDVLAEYIEQAAQSAKLTASAVRQAHKAAYADQPGAAALELLLFDVIGDAVKLMHRLEAVAACAASPRYTRP